MKKILVTGGHGLLGKSLSALRNGFIYLNSSDVDLCYKRDTEIFFDKINPTHVIHMAAKVGGIKENAAKPYDFIVINNEINSNVISYCVRKQIPITFISSTCVYPKSALCPLTEDMVYQGEPEETNDGYAYAKRFAGSLLRCAKRQHGFNYATLYLCNLYGENDHFENYEKSHLVTSLIQKFHNAKMNNKNKVELLGSGKPRRQFMYANDAAAIVIKVAEEDIYGEYNVAIEDNFSVDEIAKIVKKVVGYCGSIEYNGSLDGIMRKDASMDKLKSVIGNIPFISLEEGIKKTYTKFLENI